MCASNAPTRRRLMTIVNQTVGDSTVYYRNDPRYYYGEADPWICSVPADAPVVTVKTVTEPTRPSQAAPQPLTACGGSSKRSSSVFLQPNATAGQVTPPPEGPRGECSALRLRKLHCST